MPVRIRYFSIKFAELTGHAFYSNLAMGDKPSHEKLPGEWIFAHDLFNSAADDQAYLDEILCGDDDPASPALVKQILRARERVKGFLDWCLDEILQEQPALVGFTSVFQQHVASLSLARRLKAARPETFIVFGGANCEGVMGAETVRQFPFVDAAVSGEAEEMFPELVRRVLASETVADIPGIRTPDTVGADFERGRFSTAPMTRRLDELPYPDYGDYFEQFGKSRFDRDWQPSLLFEASRGCWWGERLHCTFCGLNPDTMAYRSKSAPRALDEILRLAERHPGCDLEVVDNILDMSYFQTLLPQLAELKLDLKLFFETKANLKKAQVGLLFGQTRVRRCRAVSPISTCVSFA